MKPPVWRFPPVNHQNVLFEDLKADCLFGRDVV